MGFIRPRGIKLCEKCGQLHGVDYDCTQPKVPQPISSRAKREPVQPAKKVVPIRKGVQKVLELDAAQEMPTEMEIGTVKLRLHVGGVQVISETCGGRSHTFTNEEFCEFMDAIMQPEMRSFAPLILIFVVMGVFWLCLGLMVFR